MKIVLINNLYGQYARGGAERVVEIIADELLRQKHEVVVVSSQPWRTLQDSRDCHGLRPRNDSIDDGSLRVTRYALHTWNIISYYNLSKLPKFIRPLWHFINIFNLHSYFEIKKILNSEKPDIVMTHNLMGVGFLTPLAIYQYVKESDSFQRNPIPKYIHTLHDIQLIHPSGLVNFGEEKKLKNVYTYVYTLVCKKLFSSPDIVISPSKWLMQIHVERGFFENSKKEVVANPVNQVPSIKYQVSSNDKIASSLTPRNDNQKLTFLYVGQIEKHKGVDLLVEAFQSLQSSQLSFRTRSNEGEKSIIDPSSQAPRDDKIYSSELLIVGDGSQVSSIKYQVSSNIKFLGKKTSTEVNELMQKADCLVVPSLCYENQPTTIIEAQQVGLPVIASDIGGITEMVSEEFLFKAGDREALVKKMEWMTNNRENIQDMGLDEKFKIKSKRAKEYIDKIFSL